MEKERKIYLDYLRVLSCIAVVMTHIFVTARTDFLNHTVAEDIISKVVAACLHFAVPVFFMITGALFLTRSKEIEIKVFLKKYVLKYIIAIFTFGLAFAMIEELFNKNYSLTMPLNAFVNTLQGKTWNHMWYLYSLVGVMLVIPFIKIVIDQKEELLKYVLGILLISSFLIPMINSIFDIKIGFTFPLVSEYLTYAIIGYYVETKNYNVSKRQILLLIIVSIMALITFGILSETVASLEFLSFFKSYNSILILILSISIFILFKKLTFKKTPKFLLDISKCTYSIYIIHMFWINLLYKMAKFNIYGDYLLIKSLVAFVFISLISYVTAKVMLKVPLIKNIL